MTWPTSLTRGTPGGSNGSQIGGAPATALQSPDQGGDFKRLTAQRSGASEMNRLLGQKPQTDFQRLLAQDRNQPPPPAVPEKLPPPPHSVEDFDHREAVKRAVKAGAFFALRRVAPRLHPVLSAVSLAYDVWSAFQAANQGAPVTIKPVGSGTLKVSCPAVGDGEGSWFPSSYTCNNNTIIQPPFTKNPVLTASQFYTMGTITEIIPPGAFPAGTIRFRGGNVYQMPSSGVIRQPRYQAWRFTYPDPEGLPWLDPFTVPGGWPTPITALPYALLPYRQPRADRHPDEQSHRGNSVRFQGVRPVPRFVSSIVRASASQRITWRQEQAARRAGQPGRDADRRDDRGDDIRKSDVPGSDRVQEKESEPGADVGGSSDPGISDQSRDYSQDEDFNYDPVIDPRLDWTDDVGPNLDLPIDPVIREDWHAGQPGPTVSYGSDLASPPHVREPAPPKTKERKRVAFRPNQAFLIKHGVNPISEVLEALDCAYKALPKKVQRQAQLASWATQRVRAEEAGVKLRRNPGHQRDTSGRIKPGADAPSVPLWGKESLTLPGFSSNARDKGNLYRDPNAHYFQPMSPQQKAEAVYLNASELDIDKMLSCMGADMLEDTVIGKFGKQVGKASARLRMSTGLGSSIF